MAAEGKAGELHVWTGTGCDCIGVQASRSLVVDHGLGALFCAVVVAMAASRLVSRVTGRDCREGTATLCAAAGFAAGCAAWALAGVAADAGMWVVSYAAALDVPSAVAGVRYVCMASAGIGASVRAARSFLALRRGEGGAAVAHAMFGLSYAIVCLFLFAVDERRLFTYDHCF